MPIAWKDLGPAARAQVEQQHGTVVAPRSPRKPADHSLEDNLYFQIDAAGLTRPSREHYFHPERQFRFDFAWPTVKLAVEVDGGSWVNGGHNRGAQMESDAVKGCEAAILGWHVMHVTTDMVTDGRALSYIERFLTSPAPDGRWRSDG